MKKIIIIFTLTFINSCSTIQKEKTFPETINNSHWMDHEDYVRYVNFFTRTPSNTGSQYNITGECDGYPKINVKTAPGFCVGLFYNGDGMRKPRTMTSIKENEYLVADMGSWSPFDGKIFHLTNFNNERKLSVLFEASQFKVNDPKREIINRPHQISAHSDGKIYIGTAESIIRFDPHATNPLETIVIVISALPSEGLHPLKSFAFDNDQSLYINVGAATNVCHKFSLGGIFAGKKKICDEAENETIGQGQIRKYKRNTNGTYQKNFEIYAKGLRNSVALAWDSEHNVLIQGENSRDAIDKNDAQLNTLEFPHDEINIVEKGKHYGWPYCYDNNINSPEWTKVDCSKYQKPHLFLPPHSAPLHLHFYNGTLFPEWYRGRILTTLHGFQAKGHRLVTFKRNEQGMPTGIPQSIIYGWDSLGEQNFGSPVGLFEESDGSVFIVEDTNKKILRLSYNSSLGDGKAVQEIDLAVSTDASINAALEETRRLQLLKKIESGKATVFTKFQTDFIDKSCVVCHGGDNAPGIKLLKYDDEGNEERIIKNKKAKLMYSMVAGEKGYPPMPPQGFSSVVEASEAKKILKLWLEQNPQIE